MVKKPAVKKKPVAKKKPTAEQVMTANELMTMATDLTRRTTYASLMGLSYDGERDMYAALGYPRIITWSQYEAKYKREGLGKRIINTFPDATWRGVPRLTDNAALDTAWQKLQKELRVVHYFTRTDRLAGIGAYAVLLLGFQDGKPLEEPVKFKRGMKLGFLSPFSEINAKVDSTVTDATNSRYGLVELYSVKLSDAAIAQKVHWSRVIHLAEGLQEDEIFGTPRLECVYNRLEDVEKIVGGSGEMFWRGAFPGYAFEKDPEAEVGEQALVDMQNEIEDFVHKLSRYIRLQGMKIKELKPQVASPRQHLSSQLQLISGATGIPLRILVGSERGELASSEDRKNWHERVQERQLDFGELVVVRPFIDRCMMAGVLKKGEYGVEWPPLEKVTEKEVAEIGLIKAKSIQTFVTGDGDQVLPVFRFLVDIIGYGEDEAKEILETLDAALDEEEKDAAATAEEDENEEEEEQ